MSKRKTAADHPPAAPGDAAHEAPADEAQRRAANDTSFDQLLALVRRDTGMDVSQYREATLRRRVDRRRRLLNLDSDEAYLAHLQQHPDEIQALQRSFLISVSSFFRDAPAFAVLRAALRRTVDEKPLDQPLRVWVPACASGEEAYTVAMVLLEALSGRARRPPIKIFATDLDAAAIAAAKRGRYESAELEGFDPALRTRYFTDLGHSHEVNAEVRELCLFAQHDVTHDVPFMHLDLISCRNLLIYLKPALQTEVLRRFQLALQPGGLLLLGRAEALSADAMGLFETLDAHQHLYRRRPGPPALPSRPEAGAAGPSAEAPAASPSEFQRAVQDTLLAAYAPTSVLVDSRSLQPLQFHGAKERYLAWPADGAARFDLPALLPPPLRIEFQTLAAVLADPARDAAQSPAVTLERDGGPALRVRLHLRRLAATALRPAPWLLSFEDLPAEPVNERAPSAQAFALLRADLERSREQARVLVQALDSANHALQTSHRELQISTEELQSSNEELVASNEELTAVNDEMQAKSEELARLNETLSNIQDSIRIGLVVVDKQLRVLRYNELAVRVFGLLPRDLGRPLDEVPCLLPMPTLAADVGGVIAGGQPFLQRVEHETQHYVMQIAPYVNRRGERAGAVLCFSDVSQLRAAETKLERSAQLLQLVMDAVPALVSYIDEQGIYRWVNRHYADWFGVDAGGIVGQPFRAITGEAIYQEVWPLIQRCFRGETVSTTKLAKRPHWSGPRWVHITYTPDRAEDGRVRGVVGTVRDITAERNAAQALQASEERARSIFEAAPQAMLVVDEAGMIVRANRRAESLFGFPLDGLHGQPLEHVLPSLAAAMRDTLSGGGSCSLQARRADGSEFPAEAGVAPVAGARAEGLIVTVQDLSLQAAAQRVLSEHQTELEHLVNERGAAAQQAEAQMRLILESTADGLYGVDAQGRITFANAATSAMLGHTSDVLMGQPAHELLQPLRDDGTAFPYEESPLAHTLRTGEPARVEHALYRHRNGHSIPVVYAVRAMWQRGQIVGAVVSFSDISERIAAEAAREAALAEAERLARVRTEFLTNMSHEIRTPLNAVLGLAEVAARGDRDRAPQETFRMILDSGQVLLGVVNDILDFSKIEAGKLRTESQPFELGPVIDRAVSLVAPRVFAKGLHFTIDEAPDLPLRLRGDALRLTQVLGNLLSNALKFTEAGGIELRVWRDLHDLWLSVHDSGIGIAPEPMKRLFKPFEQADSSTTRRFGGSGLGLVISRHLMELMGGSIGVRSELGAGSTFTLRLPMVDAEPQPQGQRRGRVVLAGIAEADQIPEALRQRGFEVACTDAAGAFAEPATLVVMDIDALIDERRRDEAIAAAVRGGRALALMTHPLAAALPPALQGHVTLLERPLRARHIAACLAAPTPSEAAPGERSGRLAPLRVLAAEDNEVNGLVLEAIMRMEGAALTLVENGQLAVQAVRDAGPGAFDIVLTDIQMPVMDGYAATREIRAIDPGLPIIGLTAHAMVEERDRCLAAGMVDHLAKPVEVEALVTTVLRHARRPAHA